MSEPERAEDTRPEDEEREPDERRRPPDEDVTEETGAPEPPD